MKWPRNLHCFCGSAQKFKKCHGKVLLPYVTKAEAAILKPDFERALKEVQKLKDNDQSYRLRKPIL
jgi:hypothetical protein